MSMMSQMQLQDFMSAEQIARLRRPANEAEGLPGRAYADPAFYELERQKLFPRGWMAIAYESDVAEPGDAVPVSVAGWDFIVTRNRQNEVKVFHNICRHRSMTVLTEPCTKAQTLRAVLQDQRMVVRPSAVDATPRAGGSRTLGARV